MPLVVVAVEQALGPAAAQLGGEFPAEVDGVLEAQVEGLSADRHLLVGGVPGQQQPAAPVLLGLAGRVTEGVHPERRAAVDVLAGDALPDLGDLRELRLAGARQGLAAELVHHHPGDAVAPAGGDGEAVREPLEAPVRDVDAVHVGPDQFAPRVGAREAEAAQAPYRAVLAVAAHHVPGPQQHRAVRAEGLDLDVLRAVGEGADGVPAPEVGAEAARPGAEQLLGADLRDLPLARVRAVQCQVERDAAEVAGHVVRRSPQLAEQAALVEDLHGARVQGRGAGLGGGGGPLLQDDHLGAAEPQFTREHEADRPGTDHDDLGVQLVQGVQGVVHRISAWLRRSPWRGRGWPGCWCSAPSGRTRWPPRRRRPARGSW